MQQKSDNVVSHYVFEAPVRIWHWLTVLCMAVLMVTGYFIGNFSYRCLCCRGIAYHLYDF